LLKSDVAVSHFILFFIITNSLSIFKNVFFLFHHFWFL